MEKSFSVTDPCPRLRASWRRSVAPVIPGLLSLFLAAGCSQARSVSEGSETVARPAVRSAAQPQPGDASTASPMESGVAPPQAASRTVAGTVAGGRAWVVCIDPGHPSETSAGADAGGLSENRLNWQVAVQLRALLDREPDIKCILTKQSERQYVTNRHRAEMANANGAALFIRLHCDVGGGHGYTWYYPDRAARKYGVYGPPVEVQRSSREAAHILNEAMKPALHGYLRSNPIRTDADTFVGGNQNGVLTGSIFSRVPTALIEMCFINQRADARFIASDLGQQKMAEALAVGIRQYLNSRAARPGGV